MQLFYELAVLDSIERLLRIANLEIRHFLCIELSVADFQFRDIFPAIKRTNEVDAKSSDIHHHVSISTNVFEADI